VKGLQALFWLGGSLLTLLGVVVSIFGTYLLTRALHPFPVSDFIEHVVESPRFAMALLAKWRLSKPAGILAPEQLFAEWQKQLEKLNRLADLAEANPERRAVSLVGVDLIFIGFVLQLVAGVFLLVDLVWTH
jgi:hypothetical protein